MMNEILSLEIKIPKWVNIQDECRVVRVEIMPKYGCIYGFKVGKKRKQLLCDIKIV